MNVSDQYFKISRALSCASAQIANRTGADLFLHSGCAYWAFNAVMPGTHKYMFQFHPHSSAVRKLLRYDFEQHHEVKWSFENETDSYPAEKIPHEYLDEWKLAEKIVCASSFTKWSLVEQGCASERIFVAPYGIVDGRPRRTVKHEKSQVCRFLFVGQGVQRKGLHHLLRAWHLDRPDHRNFSSSLVVWIQVSHRFWINPELPFFVIRRTLS